MSAQSDSDYQIWWTKYGEFADSECEYPAWRAGRAFQQNHIHAELAEMREALKKQAEEIELLNLRIAALLQ